MLYKQAETGTPVTGVIRKMGISQQTFSAGKSYAGVALPLLINHGVNALASHEYNPSRIQRGDSVFSYASLLVLAIFHEPSFDINPRLPKPLILDLATPSLSVNMPGYSCSIHRVPEKPHRHSTGRICYLGRGYTVLYIPAFNLV